MTSPKLEHLQISNFRSIRGDISVPLNSSTVLIHGDNGAGKTSLLSAIELAVRGEIEFLELADPGYQSQLLHRNASEGNVTLSTIEGNSRSSFSTNINRMGLNGSSHLVPELQRYFHERCYLPQSLLNQLLKMYQDSGSKVDSPLSEFVSTLLGLKQLDAIEGGLAPADDIRNFRKTSNQFLTFEAEQKRLESEISEYTLRKNSIDQTIQGLLTDLNERIAIFELEVQSNDLLETVQLELKNKIDPDKAAYSAAVSHKQILSSLIQQLNSGREKIENDEKWADELSAATLAYTRWKEAYGSRTQTLIDHINDALPTKSLPSDLEKIGEPALHEVVVRLAGVLDRLDALLKDKFRLYSESRISRI